MQTSTKKPHPTQVTASNSRLNYSAKRFPPYGKKLDDLRRRDLVPTLRIVVATDWRIGKLYPRIIVTPDQAVQNLRFDYLAGLHVQIAHFDHDIHIDDLITEILSIHPATFTTFNLDAVKQGKLATKLIYPQSEMEAA